MTFIGRFLLCTAVSLRVLIFGISRCVAGFFPDVSKERCAFFFDSSTLEGEDTALLRNVKSTNSANPHHVLEDLDAEIYWCHYKTQK